MRDVCSRWSELDITQIGSLIAIVGTIPAAWRLLHHAWRGVSDCVQRFFLASVAIPAGDPLNRSIVKWVLANHPRHYRSFTGHTETLLSPGSDDRAASLKKTRHAIGYLPHWSTRWLWHRGNLLVIRRRIDYSISSSFLSDTSGHTDRGIGAEDITVSCLGLSAEPIKRFILDCREWADKQTQFFVVIYARDRYGLAWKPKARQPLRHLDTVHFDHEVKGGLLADVRNYLDPRTQRRYQSRSMPYRRGYLFYGPPGTGKSSLSVAIAGEFGLDFYEVKVPSVATDADLEQMFQEIPPRCIVLLEDIDVVWVDRSATTAASMDRNQYSHQQQDHGSHGNPLPTTCTLSGLLNVLDGVGSQEGRIVIMTTNWPDRLDSALIRPGRVDMKVFLGNISRKSAEEMFLRMFSPDLLEPGFLASQRQQLDLKEIKRLASEFAAEVPENAFTPSMLQGFFQLYLESPQEAVTNIRSWVRRETESHSEKEYQVVHYKTESVC